MPRRLRKLFGLSKVEDEHGQKAPKQTPTVASHAAAPLSAGREAVDGGLPHNTPSRAADMDGIHDETLPSGRNGTLSQTTAVDSNTIGRLGQTCSYWERAAKQLEDKEPSVFAALQELRRESSRTSKDMPSEISQIIEHHRNTMENKQWSLPFKVRGKEVKIRAQLGNVWKALQTFNAVGSTLASLDPVHAGLPWAGVGFIVQGALNDSAQNAAAMEGLSQISPIVDRYLLMETIYLGIQDRSRHEDFEKYLVDLYANILKYQVAAACYCKRSTFSRFLRNLPKVDDWAKMLDDINKKDTYCKGLASVFDSLEQRRQNSTLQSIFRELDKRLGSLQNEMQGKERESARAENARIMAWICDHIPGNDHQDVMVRKKMGTQYAHSGQWLLYHNEFLAWRFEEDHGLSTLWVYGSVGTGKTSLVSRVIEWHLQGFQPELSETHGTASREDHVDHRIRQADPKCFGGIAYFYCARQGQNQSGTDPAVILRSLVRQLAWLPDSSSISPRIRTFYDRLRYDRPDSGHLSLEECAELLTEIISSHSNATIILDALDECENPYELLRELQKIATSSTGQIKLFVSSRLDVDVGSVVVLPRKIDIRSQSTGGGTSNDMDIFLHMEVKEGDRPLLKRNYPELEDRLIKVLRDRAQGMFRWAELQLAIFLNERAPFRLPKEVISRLDSLEDQKVGLPDLNLVYDEVFQRNTQAEGLDRGNAMKTFKFLLYSFVDWHIDDLATAISLDVEGQLDLAIDAGYVLDICSNFLVVDDSEHVQFAHLSAFEYLKDDRSAIAFSDMDAHAQIAEVCLSYVMSPSAQEIVKKREFDRRQALDGPLRRRKQRKAIEFAPYYPLEPGDNIIGRYDPLGLHMYALALCLEHCELASIVKRQKSTALCSLFTTFISVVEINPAFLTWIHSSLDAKVCPASPRNWTAQKTLAECRTKRDQIRAHPQDTFFAACAYNFTEILERMMGSAVSIDVNRRNEEGAPAISVACRYGHFPVVELLLDERAEVDISRNQYGFTPLYEAAVGCHPNIVALLLSRGADASARFKGCYEYIYTSALDGDEDERDVEVEIVEADETLLHAIARERCEWGSGLMDELEMSSIVSSLLKHGASIEAIDDRWETPLHIASSDRLDPHPLAVSVLLQHNAFPGAQDRDGCTPLMHSVFNQLPFVLELLLEKASIADIVRRNNHGHSVLSHSICLLELDFPDEITPLLNTVDLRRAARELGTQEGDEFVELSDVFKRIGCDVLINLGGRFLWHIACKTTSQRSLINCLQAVAENLDLGRWDWNNADFCDKLRMEKIDVYWTGEGKEDDADNDDDADDNNDTDSDDDAADDDNADDDDDTDDDDDANDNNDTNSDDDATDNDDAADDGNVDDDDDTDRENYWRMQTARASSVPRIRNKTPPPMNSPYKANKFRQ